MNYTWLDLVFQVLFPDGIEVNIFVLLAIAAICVVVCSCVVIGVTLGE